MKYRHADVADERLQNVGTHLFLHRIRSGSAMEQTEPQSVDGLRYALTLLVTRSLDQGVHHHLYGDDILPRRPKLQ